MADIRQSAAYAKFIRSIGWRVEKIRGVNVFIRSLGIAKIQRANVPADFPKIPGVWLTKLEPLVKQAPKGFRQDGWPLLASKTQRVDLENIKLKKDARYILRKFSNFNFQFLNNFQEFYEIFKKSGKRKRLWVPSYKDYLSLVNSFEKKCFCVCVNNQAGALILTHNKIAYYYYAGATAEGTRANLPYLVVWKCMQEAKKRGCKTWDWEGIYDERWPNKSWKGFTHFKKSFGGYEVEFPGSFTKWF